MKIKARENLYIIGFWLSIALTVFALAVSIIFWQDLLSFWKGEFSFESMFNQEFVISSSLFPLNFAITVVLSLIASVSLYFMGRSYGRFFDPSLLVLGFGVFLLNVDVLRLAFMYLPMVVVPDLHIISLSRVYAAVQLLFYVSMFVVSLVAAGLKPKGIRTYIFISVFFTALLVQLVPMDSQIRGLHGGFMPADQSIRWIIPVVLSVLSILTLVLSELFNGSKRSSWTLTLGVSTMVLGKLALGLPLAGSGIVFGLLAIGIGSALAIKSFDTSL